MNRRARRIWRRVCLRIALGLVVLAAAALPSADPQLTPDERTAVLLLALLAAYVTGFLVVGSRRRRT